uniref:Uncharacterized protein n=1 Tax=Nelumbo nucifera TaxID=4432 RepID=A0A822ZHF6_NELNU|nr:TPA_asm: hypothetical protein HUJ06_001079 [Nelumbo nucifera]
MAPAQVLTDIESEKKPDPTPEVDAGEANRVPLTFQDEKGLKCMNNCEDTTFDMENLLDQHTESADETSDVDVDIVGCFNANEIGSAEAKETDATEYSSSFADTNTESEDNTRLSDTEVESQFCGDNAPTSTFVDGFNSVFEKRKKKLTAHWRRYIQPLMWRCKWIELRIKELQSQALKYDKELAEYDQGKQLYFGEHALEDSAMRALPFSRQSRNEVMKRRRRKRREDTIDIPSYMSSHGLFSYYENRKSNPDGASLDDDFGNQVIAADQNINGNEELGANYEWSSLEFNNPPEQILWKIEVLQSRVIKLKTQLDKVMCKNAGKFSSAENLSLLVPSDVPTSSARTPNLPPGNGDITPVGTLYTPPQHISEYDPDLVMPESAVSSHGEATPHPDIIESTMGLLSAANVALDQPQMGDSCHNMVDDILIHNQAAQEEFHNFERISGQPIEKPQKMMKDQEEILPVSATEPDLAPKIAKEQSTVNASPASEFKAPKNKRKRGDRKAYSGGWSRRSSGKQRKHRV